MPKYRKKPVEVEATRWFKMGDHPKILQWMAANAKGICAKCDKPLGRHGKAVTFLHNHLICPGDYIIKDDQGEYPCKPDVFAATYDLVEDGE